MKDTQYKINNRPGEKINFYFIEKFPSCFGKTKLHSHVGINNPFSIIIYICIFAPQKGIANLSMVIFALH
jgi:hypothetical protein